jgi:hypothetical protein
LDHHESHELQKGKNHVKFTIRGASVKLGAVGLAAAVATMFGGSAAWAAGTNAGNATITDAAHAPLNSGGSQTTFSITLPQGAACSGDTTTGRFHVFGYIVPTSQDPGALTWDANGPVLPNNVPTGTPGGDFYTLYGTDGSPFVNQATAITTGQVLQAPPLNYANFSIDGSGGSLIPLPAGTYNVGIACVTPAQTTDKFWNAQETFTASGTDPNGEVWSVVPGNPVPESPLTVALPVTAAALIGVGVVVGRRRRHSVATPVG